MFRSTLRETLVLKVVLNEYGKEVERTVTELRITPENLQLLWLKCKDLKVIFGRQLTDISEFQNLLMSYDSTRGYVSTSLVYIIDDFLGILSISDIRPLYDANVHFIFFDKVLNGREKLVKEMLRYIFTTYNFQRLSAEIPHYASKRVRHFANSVGFVLEGKKRKCSLYENLWFDSSLYGILKSEVIKDGQLDT